MDKNKKFTAIFLAAELTLYAAYMCLDIFTALDTSAIKFAAVALCFLMSAAFLRKGRFIPSALICLAILFSLTADIFLLLLGKYYTVGVALFILAQIAYALNIILLRGQSVLVWLAARAAFAVAAAVAAKIFFGDILISLAAAYALLSLFNIIHALDKRETRLLAAGLILLFLCDVCVGIVNINRLFNWERIKKLAVFAGYGMWFFYLPSQVCAALVNVRYANENIE